MASATLLDKYVLKCYGSEVILILESSGATTEPLIFFFFSFEIYIYINVCIILTFI